ncbi:uncharacterized protein MEPE_01386 [Melanopsichium pennsylvanicum]|uniref:Uncharacterized protein n=2 Tax=Melanopsichium pennsylvanicum TaxID=63383 RepID=A0AAJ5C3J3_9BASI|nr:uncharacterized protein BN887_03984 [Melanopsichium pennsylvanicum 4]SNX82680.1 uncharacterized protein MEPE_01386 [Melanopsichium pennsylvanicum]
MALNMDDLIGSMQHGFHAGDRGNDLNEIRESLKVSLGPQHPSNQPPTAGPSNPSHHYNLRSRSQHHPSAYQQGGSSSLDADVAMLSSSLSTTIYTQHNFSSQGPQQCFGGGGGGQSSNFFGASGGGPGSWGSQSSGSSSNFGIATGSNWGFAPAPANTPQQTPVETSALARQLQAELERQNAASSCSTSPPQYASQTSQNAPPLSSTQNSNGPQSTTPPLHTRTSSGGMQSSHGGNGDQPRSYVNGFATTADATVTREASSTPTAMNRFSASPQLRNNNYNNNLYGQAGLGQ